MLLMDTVSFNALKRHSALEEDTELISGIRDKQLEHRLALNIPPPLKLCSDFITDNMSCHYTELTPAPVSTYQTKAYMGMDVPGPQPSEKGCFCT